MKPDLCTRIDDLVHDMLNGTISELGRQALEAHIETCPRCRESLAKTEAADEEIRDVLKAGASSPQEMPVELRRLLRRRDPT
jgi:anti-sigma factor RsiW